jgi:DNA-binding winged helix-turn-helix (wHTH) protein
MNLPTRIASADGAALVVAAGTELAGAPFVFGNHQPGGVIFVFGNHQLDHGRFELRRDGTRVLAQPKALRLLFYLVAHRARAVPSDELLAQLWRGESVTRGSLKRAVLSARRALGEAGERLSSIRTVRGHGYHFVRPVQVITWQDAQAARIGYGC